MNYGGSVPKDLVFLPNLLHKLFILNHLNLKDFIYMFSYQGCQITKD